MTTLVAWLGVDQRGPSSLYLASDSRLTWPAGEQWDSGRKLFSARTLPHILGYCGDVLYPTQVLSQLVEMMDAGLLFDRKISSDGMTKVLSKALIESLETYPNTGNFSATILHGFRIGNGVGAQYRLRQIDVRAKTVLRIYELEMPPRSGIIVALGSGVATFATAYAPWRESEVGGTSRAVFSALVDSIDGRGDPKTGGPPQLIGLYRQGGGQTFGIISKGRRYFYGTEVPDAVAALRPVRWHNELFEICDPATRSRARNAQPQPRPRGLEARDGKPPGDRGVG